LSCSIDKDIQPEKQTKALFHRINNNRFENQSRFYLKSFSGTKHGGTFHCSHIRLHGAVLEVNGALKEEEETVLNMYWET
jgi:hypothetical protein